MSAPTKVTFPSQFKSLLSSHTYLIADFYADWCGPCKAIAPLYEQLARSEGKPGRLAFVKVDVDSQQEIAKTYGVTAMPTFLIFKNGTVSNTLRGANPAALRSAVMTASADAARGPAKASASFASKGHVLGSEKSASTSTPSSRSSGVVGAPIGQWSLAGLMDTVGRFFGLYVTTLLSLDPKAVAEVSPYRAPEGMKRG